jgi:hypothetical protein
MDWLEFVAAIVSATAWPAVLIVAIILLRKPLSGLIPLLRHVKYKELELEFAQEVQELREEAEAALRPLVAPPFRATPEEDSLLQLAAVSPRAAVVEAWRLVESSARQAIEARGVPVEGGRSLVGPQLTRTLGLAEVLDDPTRSLMDRLRMLRNQAVHAEDFLVDEASAREYLQLALALVRRIDEEIR